MFYRIKKIRFMFLAFLLVLIIVSAATALAGTNILPVTHLSDQSSLIMLNELVPPECASIRYRLEDIVDCRTRGNPCISNGNKNELILGTAGNDFIDGGNGDDCIVGGGGDDILRGGNGNDVLVGGPGSDSLYGEGRNKDIDKCIDDATTFFDLSCEEFDP
jgi:Ca2+-binding RTX toxin-like protein